jgi:aminopeptidase N
MEIFRNDYQPLPFTVSKISLEFDIFDGKTIVTSTFSIVQNNSPTVPESIKDTLVLDGEEDVITLCSITVDDKELVKGEDYLLEKDKLVLKNPKDGQVISIKVEIVPETNTTLQGLYKSASVYCTQCEAMGFRRITYYPDRPDNMAIFEKVRICACTDKNPILLSNGNLIETGVVDPGSNDDSRARHYAVWSDPFPKPSYLFAIVAGDLGKIDDNFVTQSGRNVNLSIYSEHNNVSKLKYAMGALQRSMKWDEDRFGVSYVTR